jgi:hypothetical protein
VAASRAAGVARRSRSLGGSLWRGAVRACVWLGWEWPGARDPSDPLWPPRHVGRCVCRKTPWVLGSTARCLVHCPKGEAARDGLTGGEVPLRLVNVLHGEVRGVQLVC